MSRKTQDKSEDDGFNNSHMPKEILDKSEDEGRNNGFNSHVSRETEQSEGKAKITKYIMWRQSRSESKVNNNGSDSCACRVKQNTEVKMS